MPRSLSLFDKIWNDHVIIRRDGADLLWVDRHLLHEASDPAFDLLRRSGNRLRRPDLTFGTTDRYVPSNPDTSPTDKAGALTSMQSLKANGRKYGFDTMDHADPRRGIVHLVGPEQGLTLPGLVVACADSHCATHGAFGCLGIGISMTEAAHVLATQSLWRHRPRLMRVVVRGALNPFVSAKDLILTIVARLGTTGATGHAVEFAGPAIEDMSVEGRMTLCNMAVEAGAWTAIIAPDQTTFAWLRARPRSPKGRLLVRAVSEWRMLATDPEVMFDAEVVVNAGTVHPAVTWGSHPDTALPVTDRVPHPASAPDTRSAEAIARQITAMGLLPNQPLEGIRLDRVFIGSCTNGGLEDLRDAAAVLRGRSAVIPGLVVAGSVPVKRQAEREGLDQIFTAAGLQWGEPGCSACIGLNGDLVPPGERCAATTSRNFVGRQGPGSRTHLMAPAMAAAAAIAGAIVDVRKIAA